MSAFAVSPGQVLAGKYRVDRVLGQGGMGVVVAATHVHLDERVALKFLLPHMAKGEVVARFIREAKAAVRIRSEHVARVSDVGALDDGAPYMVMEYLEGGDLSQVQASRGTLPLDEVVDYILQACVALAEAHSYGIVHRDLKPANLFLTRRVDGSACVKVLDFGISKLLSQSDDSALTKTGSMLGSPLYMSPEQLTSAKQIDHRSDIWSLGVIMYELLTATPPFMGEELPQLVVAILQAGIRPLSDFRFDLPPAFNAVVMRCLTRERDQRYQNVLELAEALAPFATARAARSIEAIRGIMGKGSNTGFSAPSASLPPAAAVGGTLDPVGVTNVGQRTLDPVGATNSGQKSIAAPSRSKSNVIPFLAGAALALVMGAVVTWRLVRAPANEGSIPPPAEQPVQTAAAKSAAPPPEPEPPPAAPTVTSAVAKPAESVAPSKPTIVAAKTTAAPTPAPSATQSAYDRAKQLMQSGDLDAAEREARAAVATHGNGARLLLGEILERKGKPGLARDIYKKILETDPSNATAKTRLAKLGG